MSFKKQGVHAVLLLSATPQPAFSAERESVIQIYRSESNPEIKSLSENRLESIHNTINGMAENVDEFICDTNAVVIHAGTNNLSDGDSIETIVGQYTEIAETSVKQQELVVLFHSAVPNT